MVGVAGRARAEQLDVLVCFLGSIVLANEVSRSSKAYNTIFPLKNDSF